MNDKPTTVRFTDTELELIDAAARHLSLSGVKHSRTDVLRVLLRQATPPAGDTDTAKQWRRAHRAVYGDTP